MSQTPVREDLKNPPKFSAMKPTKPATAIMLQETRTLHRAGGPEKCSPTTCVLADKIEELVLKVGYSNAQALSVIIQLLTDGKVRVDFRDYSQRLQVISPSDLTGRVEAMQIFDSHIASMRVGATETDGFTQKITLQPPLVRLPQ
jgi:hypothetical protein